MDTSPRLLAGLLILALVGCGAATTPQPASTSQPTVAQPSASVDVRGSIIKLDPPAGANPRTLLVEGLDETTTTYPSARVRVPDDTLIFRQADGTKLPVTLDQLELDQRIEVIFRGPVSRSIPPQATAAEIVILP